VSTKDAVVGETPARFATSASVARFAPLDVFVRLC
jgi:hypothetical protein